MEPLFGELWPPRGVHYVSIVSGKPKHLFVVKDGRAGAGGRTVSAEQFTPEQRAAVERVLSLVPRPPGVLVGAHFMEALWDVRPLVLEKGVMTITRLSDPGLDPERRQALRRTHGALNGVVGVIAAGEFKGSGGAQLWMRRRYYPATLGESPSTDGLSSMHPLHLARRLIAYVRYLEGLGVVHGHIVPNNVIIEGDSPGLLDYGFAAWSGAGARYHDLAPEVGRGEVPVPASDVFGLAIVLRALLGGALSAEQLRFLESMMAESPGERPVSGAVEAFFSGHSPGTVGVPPRDFTAPPRVSSGRVVQPPATATVPTVESAGDKRAVDARAPDPKPHVASVAAESVSPERSRRVVERNGSSTPVLLFGGMLALVVALLFQFNIVQWGGEANGPQIPYQVYWASGQAPMMRQVAEAALTAGDPAAEMAIVSDALKGSAEPSGTVRTRLLRVGYNPLWQHELEGVDRDVLLGLALAKIVPERAPRSLDVRSLHPGAVVALAADVDLARAFPELAEYSLVEVAQLPAPYGPVFLELMKQQVQYLGDPAARAVSHLLAGDLSPQVLQSFVPAGLAEESLRARVKILAGLIAKIPGGERMFLAAVADSGALPGLLGWFEEDELVDWRTVGVRDRLAVIGGLPTAKILSVEQWADLLRFPLAGVRQLAGERLREKVRAGTATVLEYLIRQDAVLSREQAVALVAAMEVEGDSAPAFIQGWYATEPSSKAVVELLISRSGITEIDGFNVEGARYLKTHQWDFTLDQIEALTRHSEPLVRALAYARLDPRDTAQRSVLEKASAAELSPKLKEQVLAKLKVR